MSSSPLPPLSFAHSLCRVLCRGLLLTEVCATLYEASELIIGAGTGMRAMGGLFFLRFVSPEVVSSLGSASADAKHAAGSARGADAMRSRILLTKVLQALATEVRRCHECGVRAMLGRSV